jgi:hypothetical protein
MLDSQLLAMERPRTIRPMESMTVSRWIILSTGNSGVKVNLVSVVEDMAGETDTY